MKPQALVGEINKNQYDSLCSEVAVAIHSRRKELGLSQVKVSELSRVSVGTIKTLENGKSSPSLDNLMRVLYVLGLRLVLEVKDDGYRFTCQDKNGVTASSRPE